MEILTQDLYFCLEMFLLANEYDMAGLRWQIRFLIVRLRRQAIESGDVELADEILEAVLELYEESYLPDTSLVDDMAHLSAQFEDDHSVHYYSIWKRHHDWDDMDIEWDNPYYIFWKTEQSRYISFVEKTNDALAEIEGRIDESDESDDDY